MKILLLILLVLVPLVTSTLEEDLNYTKAKLKEYNARHHIKTRPSKKTLVEETEQPKNHLKTIVEVNMEGPYAESFYEGDIFLTREQADAIFNDKSDDRQKRQAMNINHGLYHLWDRNISYQFEPTYDNDWKKYTRYAASLYSNLTCLRLQENGPQEQYIKIVNGYGCSSYIGRSADIQEVSLGSRCQAIRQAVHEIGHALGMHHAHSRHDRDDYVEVREDLKLNGNYNKQSTYTNDNLDVPYDYGSVMHYPRNSYFWDSIQAKDKKYEMTMGSYLDSFNDILTINRLYKCIDDCRNYNTPCANGGYPNPNKCNECTCPRGFGGVDCSDLPYGGEIFILEPGKETCVTGRHEGVPLKDLEDTEYKFNVYWMTNNLKKKIQVTYNYMMSPNGYFDNYGCTLGGTEIKAREDKTLTGYRFCEFKENIILSNTSLVPIIVYTRLDVSNSFKFCAEIVDEETTTMAYTTTTQPAATTTQPATTTTQPAITTTQPITTTTQPATTTTQPATTTTQPATTTTQPITTTTQPATTTTQPATTTTQPATTTTQPATTTTQPAITTTQPITTTTQPATTTTQPATTTTQPAITTTQPITNTTQPDMTTTAYPYEQPTTYPGQQTTTQTNSGIPETCIDIDGNNRRNGEEWKNVTTGAMWVCKNGWTKVIYCEDSILGRIIYKWESKSSLPHRNMSRCEEGGTVAVDAPVTIKDCKDHNGLKRSHGETWEVSETLVNWQCFSGYSRPIKCRYFLQGLPSYPLFMDYLVNATLTVGGKSTRYSCDVDGMLPVATGGTTVEAVTTQSTTTHQATTPSVPIPTTGNSIPGSCVDVEGNRKINGEQWKNETTQVTWTCKNGWNKVLYCEDSVLGKLNYMNPQRGQKPLRNLSRCVEAGVVEVEALENIQDCYDHYGQPRQHGDTWQIPETMVTWQCISGYPRANTCLFSPNPHFSMPVKFGTYFKTTNEICDVDGIVPT